MALLSPGTQVTVNDESFFAPAISTSIPYILLATAQDKTNSSGDIASGTTLANANIVTPVTSRRELVSLFGNPTFTAASTGGVVQAHELSEYGLQTAYSLLGVTSRVYVQRADIDLGQLAGTSVRPTNAPANGTLWLDLTLSAFGLFEWNSSTQLFTKIAPRIITATADQTAGVPNANIGTVGEYAITTVSASNPVYYKNNSGTWVLVGSNAWLTSSFTLQGTIASPTFVIGDTFDVNNASITLTGTTLAQTVIDINTVGPTGVTVAATNNKLTFYVAHTATSDGSTADGKLLLDNLGTGDTAFNVAGITGGTYNTLEAQLSAHTTVPEWKTLDTTPRPTGSVWVKTTLPNTGADYVVSIYDNILNAWTRITAPLYSSNAAANKALDLVGGGLNIPSASLYVRYDTVEDGTATSTVYNRSIKGATVVTGSVANPTLAGNETFTISVSAKGSSVMSAATTITVSSTDPAAMVVTVMGSAIANLEATQDSAGKVVFTHTAGGTIVLKNTSGTALATMGFSNALTLVEDGNDTDLILSNWVAATYTASLLKPSVDPVDGTYWYDSTITDVDIMVHNGTIWKGYKNVTNDARNADLSNTSPNGPIVSASEPLTQSDATAIQLGDLWINTSVINDYPIINRWTAMGAGVEAWVIIDNADGTSENGIIFADARWDIDGTTDTITGTAIAITSMLVSDYVDLDVPNPALYPRGTLLWNTRRSGSVVKQYTVDYFNSSTFTGALPTEKHTWRTVSGLKLDGSPYMGSGAQRNMIVQAMKAGVDASLTVREETTTVNLLAAVGYPELMSNLIKVNTDRKETSFIVGDSPMKLAASSLALTNWASNAGLAADNGPDGLVSDNAYLGVYYPSGLTNDLAGNSIVMPSSHMALRTIIKSDNVSYPWIAPAGIRRGKVDNATSVGYVDSLSNEYQSVNIGAGLRDVLYTNNVNPISVLPGSGVTVYGQKTRQTTASSLDRVNVARSVASLRYVLDLIARPFVFEPNDKLTRDEFKGEIEKYLNELVTKRAIFDYLVVCDNSNNTPSRIDRNELWADVAIEPVKAAEFIYVPLRLKNTGEL